MTNLSVFFSQFQTASTIQNFIRLRNHLAFCNHVVHQARYPPAKLEVHVPHKLGYGLCYHSHRDEEENDVYFAVPVTCQGQKSNDNQICQDPDEEQGQTIQTFTR